MAGVHPCVWEVWVLSGVLALGGGVCRAFVHPGHVRVRAPTEVARVPACRGGSVYQPVPLVYVQLWLRTSGRACLFTWFGKRAPPLAPTRGPGALLRAGPAWDARARSVLARRRVRARVRVSPRVCGHVLGSARRQPCVPYSCAERHVCVRPTWERVTVHACARLLWGVGGCKFCPKETFFPQHLIGNQ